MGRGQKRTFRDGTNTTLQNFDRATATLENYYKGANAQSPTVAWGTCRGKTFLPQRWFEYIVVQDTSPLSLFFFRLSNVI